MRRARLLMHSKWTRARIRGSPAPTMSCAYIPGSRIARESTGGSAGGAPPGASNGGFIAPVMWEYVYLDRFDEAKAVAGKAFSQKLDGDSIHYYLLVIAYIQDDRPAQEKQIEWYADKPGELNGPQVQALNAMTHGQRHKANELFQRAGEMARRQG